MSVPHQSNLGKLQCGMAQSVCATSIQPRMLLCGTDIPVCAILRLYEEYPDDDPLPAATETLLIALHE
jgi:hypothetical protein